MAEGFEFRELGPHLLRVTLPSGITVLAKLKPAATDRRLQIVDLRINGGVVRSGDLRMIPIEAIEARANATEEPLPDVSNLDRAMLVEVWAAFAQRFVNPSAELARRSGLKAPRIHTWVREARMRGLLPPTPRCSSFGPQATSEEPTDG